jgi:anaerobic selenocysteine-containing dehydrogenase
MGIEVPTASWASEKIESYSSNYGMPEPFGMYAPRLLEPPAGSDLIEEWELMYVMAQRMGLPLTCAHPRSASATLREERAPVSIDMSRKPSSEELFEVFMQGSRIPFDEVRRHPDGAVFPEQILTAAKEPGCGKRFQVADPDMMAELRAAAFERSVTQRWGEDYPLLMICRRAPHLNNSSGLDIPSLQRKGGSFNPAYLNPEDLRSLGLEEDEAVVIRSPHGSLNAIVAADDSLRRGVVSMTHSYGLLPGVPADVRLHGSNTSQLTSVTDDFDSFSGIPRMSAVAVSVRRV